MSTEILDPIFDPRHWQPANRRRLLLVAYVDFLIFCVPWGLLVFALDLAFPQLGTLPPLARLVVFAVFEGVLLRLCAWSPGADLLGLRFVPLRDHASPIDQLWQGLVPFVANERKERESWFTLGLAVWFLNEGCKSMVRWTMWNAPAPFFGNPTDEFSSALIYLVCGGIEIFIAVKLFRVELQSALVGVPYTALQIASAMLSWKLWDGWVGEMLVRRREYMGLPVREGEVEQMQAMMPEMLILAGILNIVLLLAAVPRLRSSAPYPEPR